MSRGILGVHGVHDDVVEKDVRTPRAPGLHSVLRCFGSFKTDQEDK